MMLVCINLLHVWSDCFTDHDWLSHSNSLDSVEICIATTPHVFLCLMMTKWSLPCYNRLVIHKWVWQHVVLQQIVLLTNEIWVLLLLAIWCLLLEIGKKVLVLSRVNSLWCSIITTKWMLDHRIWVQHLRITIDFIFKWLLSIIKLTAKVLTRLWILSEPIRTHSLYSWWTPTHTCQSLGIDSAS